VAPVYRSEIRSSGLSATFMVIVDGTLPTVSVQVNDGNPQRSMIGSLTVVFSEPVTLSGGATLLTHVGVPVPSVVTNPSNDRKTYVKTFGSALIGGSLANGYYDVVVNAGAAKEIAGNFLIANLKTTFFRLLGDANGSGTVDAGDFDI